MSEEQKRIWLEQVEENTERENNLKKFKSPYIYPGLKAFVQINTQEDLLRVIVALVADYFGLTPELLRQRSRKREYVVPRQLAHYFCKMVKHPRFKMSLSYIGQNIGDKDHATVMHSKRTVIAGIEMKDAYIYPPYKELKNQIPFYEQDKKEQDFYKRDECVSL